MQNQYSLMFNERYLNGCTKVAGKGELEKTHVYMC